MAEPATETAPTSILDAPEPKPEPTPEAVLFKGTTPGEPTPKAPEPEAKPSSAAVPEKKADSEPKPPKEPTKPGEPEKTPATAPAEYDLKLPENSRLTEEDLKALTKEVKEKGLTKEQAEDVLKSRNQTAQVTWERFTEQAKVDQAKAIESAKALWTKEIQDDPEIGGERLPETTALASRAYKALFTDVERREIEQTGLNFNSTFVRGMLRAGRMMAEDRVVRGQVGGRPGPQTETFEGKAAALYGKTTPGADGKLAGEN